MTPEEYDLKLSLSISNLHDPFEKMQVEREKLWRAKGDNDIREHSFQSIGFRLSKLAAETKIARLEQENFQACHELLMREQEAETIRNQIAKLRIQNDIAEKEHVKDMLEKESKLAQLKKRFNGKTQEFEKDGHIYLYANAMTECGKKSDYVLLLQARLCHAVHHFAIFESHVKFADNKSIYLIEKEKEQLQTQLATYTALEDLTVKFFTLAYEEQIYRLNAFKEAVKPQKDELFQIQLHQRDAHKKEMQQLQNEMDNKNTYQKSVSFKLEPTSEEPEPSLQDRSLPAMSMSFTSFNFKHNVPHDANQVLESKLTVYHSPLKVLEDHNIPRNSIKRNSKRATAA